MTPGELISAHLDHGLDDAGYAELDAWLAADRAHQVQYCQAVLDHQHLLQRGASALHATTPSRAHLRLRPAPSRWLPLGAAAAAAAVLVALFGWWVLAPAGDDAPMLAQAEATEALHPDGVHLSLGERMRPGDRLTTGAGAATLRYADGTSLVLAAGSAATILPSHLGKRLRLEHGELEAQVAKQPRGRPLVLSAAGAEVTVVGTTLAIACTRDEARVSVSTGLVEVSRAAEHIALAAGSFTVAAAGVPLQARPAEAPIGRVFAVGNGQRFASVAALPALEPGDVVELHPGRHQGGWKLEHGGTALRPLVIRGIGAERPLLDGSGQDLDGAGTTPRAVLQLHGSNVVVEHLAISGGRNGRNAAGIRCAEASAITIRDCRISDCDQGIDAVADRVLILDNDIGPCGTAAGDGYCHLLHLGGGAATVRGNLLHDALYGQAVMSGNRSLLLEANRISGAADGEISLLDPGQERSVAIRGNLLVGRVRDHGNHVRTIEVHGASGGDLTLAWNTVVAAEPSAIVLMGGATTMRITAVGNLVSGTPQIVQAGMSVTGRANQLPADAAVPARFSDGITAAADPGFSDPARGDYRLRADAVGAGRVRQGGGPGRQPATGATPGSLPRADGDDPGAFSAPRR